MRDKEKPALAKVTDKAAPATKADGKTIMEDRWYSVDEIAAYLGVQRETIYSWINQRQMPARKIGRLWKFKKTAVDEWVESGSFGEQPSHTNEEK
jgi:excisionase family DNA binding protein